MSANIGRKIKSKAPILSATVQAIARCACGWELVSPEQQVKNGGGGGDEASWITKEGRKHAGKCGPPGRMKIKTIQLRTY